ncbi:MAG TPA: type II secretion system protein [Patescibacteria group bacterium]|nr:type II secretion system protein [Patescibacteria group bacterium]
MKSTKSKGFTLIELLVVIGILAVLLAITLIAINPARQFSQSNNTKRRSDVNAVLNAINQYMADNKGTLPTGIDATLRTITNDPVNPAGVDLCTTLVTQYIAALPVDPLTNNGTPVSNCAAGTYDTNYTVQRSAADNRITIRAPAAELGEVIEVTR